jgi:hypothetical protein
MGCYTDDSARALPVELASSGATRESCVAAAKAQGLTYAGLQYGGWCFGGNSLGYVKVSDSECDMPCDADTSQICGGSWRNSIYSTGSGNAPSPSPSPSPSPTGTAAGGDTVAPAVSITSPANGAIVSRNSIVTITANASDTMGVSRVEFYVDGSLKCTDTTASYTCAWKVPGKRNSSYQIEARAYDLSGNMGMQSISLRSQ